MYETDFFSIPSMELPVDYIAGDPIVVCMLLENQSFESLNVTNGVTATATWNTGGADEQKMEFVTDRSFFGDGYQMFGPGCFATPMPSPVLSQSPSLMPVTEPTVSNTGLRAILAVITSTIVAIIGAIFGGIWIIDSLDSESESSSYSDSESSSYSDSESSSESLDLGRDDGARDVDATSVRRRLREL